MRLLTSCGRPTLSRRDEGLISKSTAAFSQHEKMMDVPYHIRLMSNDNHALRRRRAIRHLPASLPSGMPTRLWCTTARHRPRQRGTLFLLLILHPSRHPLRRTLPNLHPGRRHAALMTNAVGNHNVPLSLPRNFHHFQSVWLETPPGGGGVSPRRPPLEQLLRSGRKSGSPGGEATSGLGSAACDQSQPVMANQ